MRAVDTNVLVRLVTRDDGKQVAAALEHYRRRPALGFSDCLILEVARKAGHVPLAPLTEILESSMELKDCKKIAQRVGTLQRHRRFPAIRTPNSSSLFPTRRPA